MATFSNLSKHSSTATNVSKNAFTASNQSKSLAGSVTASIGQSIGLLLSLTYASEAVLTAGTAILFTNLNKS